MVFFTASFTYLVISGLPLTRIWEIGLHNIGLSQRRILLVQQ